MHFLLHILCATAGFVRVLSGTWSKPDGTSSDVIPKRTRRSSCKWVEKSKMDADGPDISTCLARNPEYTDVTVIVELDELGLLDEVNTELAFAC